MGHLFGNQVRPVYDRYTESTSTWPGCVPLKLLRRLPIAIEVKTTAWRFATVVLLLLLGIGSLSFGAESGMSASAATNPPFRLAFTTNMFTEVNEQDVRAALRVWIKTLVQERGISVDPNPQIYATSEDAAAAARRNQIDGIALTTPEYYHLTKEVKFDRFAVGIRHGQAGDEYVLLVREDSGLQEIEQLQGCSLNVLQNPRTSLSMTWLDTLLLQRRLKPAMDTCSHVNFFTKASRTCLPVFFRQADACLLTRDNFDTMGELNPQLGKQLRILASSPRLVADVFAFRTDYKSAFRDKILKELQHMSETASGRQILLLTQDERIEERPISCLQSALELLAAYQRLSERGLTARNAAGPLSGPDQDRK